MGRPKKTHDYLKTIKLKHNEIPAKINLETGEVTGINQTHGQTNLVKFDHGKQFKKEYNNSWLFLLRELKPLEVSAVSYLVSFAKMNTGSLEPLNDDMTVRDLSFNLNISVNRVNQILKVLFLYGVYGKFEVYNPDKPFTKYWLINPHLAFAGTHIDSDILSLFKDTYVAKAYFNPNFVFKHTKRNEHLIPK